MSLFALAFLLQAAAQPVPAPSGPTIPPAEIDNSLEITGDALDAEALRNRLFIDVGVNGAGPFRFLVDSGADRSVVSLALAQRLKLPAGDTVRLQGMAGTQQVPTVEIDAFRIGGSEIGPIRAPALQSRHLGADGLIGIDALADQRLMLDFVRKTVTVQDSRKPVTAAEAGEIVVTARRRKGQLILTQASVRGARLNAVIDTGSEITLGNMALRRRLFGIRTPNGMKPVTLISVTGQTLIAEGIVLDDVRIGGILLNNVVVAFADAPPFALFGLAKEPSLFLGSDLLNSFRRVSLDFRNRKVRFTLR